MCGLGRIVSGVVSDRNAAGSSLSGTDVFELNYLEGNSWLWDVGGLKILVDPILVGNLDFGIPWLYDAAKKFLRNFQLSELPEVHCFLITQDFDNPCHLKTLKPLSAMYPDIRIILTPNAKEKLDPLFSNVTYLEPGKSSNIEAGNGSLVRIQAPAGPVVGPPWRCPENGFQMQELLYKELPDARVLEPTPGVPVGISPPSDLPWCIAAYAPNTGISIVKLVD